MHKVNNTIYNTLDDRWYTAKDDPIALLRAESRFRNPWIHQILNAHEIQAKDVNVQILDLGCGAGFLSNFLASQGYQVIGLDQSESSLRVAKENDSTKSVQYLLGDAYQLPFEDGYFDAVLAMDFLEHVERPFDVLKEVKRVLKPQGLFFFHTFAKNWLSHLIVIKGVEWFVKNTPSNLHVIDLFISPKNLRTWMQEVDLIPKEMFGVGPKIFSRSFLNLLFTGTVSDDFCFVRTRPMWMGYMGFAQKRT